MAHKESRRRLQRVPPNILDKIARFEQDLCVAGCSLKIDRRDVQAGVFKHLGLCWENGQLTFAEQVIPLPERGPTSRVNIEGKDVPQRHLPKIWKGFSTYTPNFGDWSKGGHFIDRVREVYQRDYIAAQEIGLQIEKIGASAEGEVYFFRFSTDAVLDRTASTFQDDILFNLNLLLENVGNFDVFPSTALQADYLRTLYVNWELLPPGQRDATIATLMSPYRSSPPSLRRRIEDRYDTLARLGPTQYIRGTNEFRRYFGAQFADDLIVFENIDYGNAIYVISADWQVLSRKSRMDLLAHNPDEVVRIRHTKTWKPRLQALVQREIRRRH